MISPSPFSLSLSLSQRTPSTVTESEYGDTNDKPTRLQHGYWCSMGSDVTRMYIMGDTSSGSSTYSTNAAALIRAIYLNGFRMREIAKIVVLGLRGLGTVEQLRANAENQGLSAEKHTQNVAITQLEMTLVIRGYIQSIQHAPVAVYVCDHDLDKEIKAAIHELGCDVFRPAELFRHINCNTLVYDVTMHAAGLREIVNFSFGGIVVQPAAVITHINSLVSDGAVGM